MKAVTWIGVDIAKESFVAAQRDPEGFQTEQFPVSPKGLKAFGKWLPQELQLQIVLEATGGGKVDLVLSDMAPNISGVRDIDQVRCTELARVARDFALECLRPGGRLVVKLFEGTETASFQRETRALFEVCAARKPVSSRPESPEFFLVARRAEAL